MSDEISISLNEVVLDFPVSKSGPAFLKEIFTGRINLIFKIAKLIFTER